MNPTWADVLNVAPELASIPVGAQGAILAYAIAQLNVTNWGALWSNGVVYLAAHLGTLARNRGGGMVTSESVGALSRSYATPGALGSGLGMTAYGAEYLRLVRLLPTALGTVA